MTSLSPEHSLPCEPHCADGAAAVIASEVLAYRAFPQLGGGADIRNVPGLVSCNERMAFLSFKGHKENVYVTVPKCARNGKKKASSMML